jgi:hypothetical protein
MDMSKTIAPKSNQLNADDLIGDRSLTITVTQVDAGPSLDQPVAIHYEGGLPYLPCKSMRRVLVHCWGKDAKVYVGRSMTLFRDEKVRFGGAEVGGIRISHLSHIEGSQSMALTASRAQRKLYTVQPLTTTPSKQTATPPNTEAIDEKIALARLATTSAELEQIATTAGKLRGWTPAKKDEMAAVLKIRREEFSAQADRQPGDEG